MVVLHRATSKPDKKATRIWIYDIGRALGVALFSVYTLFQGLLFHLVLVLILSAKSFASLHSYFLVFVILFHTLLQTLTISLKLSILST
jgi:hypothetical protein